MTGITKAGRRGYAGRSRRQHGRFSDARSGDPMAQWAWRSPSERQEMPAVALVRNSRGCCTPCGATASPTIRTTRARRQGWPAWWRTPSCPDRRLRRPAPSWGGRSSAGSANATTPACTRPGPATQVRLKIRYRLSRGGDRVRERAASALTGTGDACYRCGPPTDFNPLWRRQHHIVGKRPRIVDRDNPRLTLQTLTSPCTCSQPEDGPGWHRSALIPQPLHSHSRGPACAGPWTLARNRAQTLGVLANMRRRCLGVAPGRPAYASSLLLFRSSDSHAADGAILRAERRLPYCVQSRSPESWLPSS